jgi:hypothetical protein
MNDGHETYLLGGEARLLRADRLPCPVCGHPTGDCVGEEREQVPLVGSNTFPSLEREDLFIVEEDVYEDRAISPFTTARVLVAAKGASIPWERAQELGLA